MARDTHIEIAVEPYRKLLAPAWDDTTFADIEPRTPAAQRFARADTLAEVLAMALDDLAVVLGDKRYVINLGSWHAPQGDGCEVCLAGAVISQSLGAPIDHWLNPDDFTWDVEVRLMALDNLRQGNVLGAVSHLHGASPARTHVAAELTGKYSRILRRFAVDPVVTSERAEGFLAIMRAMLRDLAEVGL